MVLLIVGLQVGQDASVLGSSHWGGSASWVPPSWDQPWNQGMLFSCLRQRHKGTSGKTQDLSWLLLGTGTLSCDLVQSVKAHDMAKPEVEGRERGSGQGGDNSKATGQSWRER